MCAKSAITVFKFPAHAQALLIDTLKMHNLQTLEKFLISAFELDFYNCGHQ